jgi:hypothetical protein
LLPVIGRFATDPLGQRHRPSSLSGAAHSAYVHLYRRLWGASSAVRVGQRCDRDVYPYPLARSG